MDERLERVLTGIVVAISCGFVFWQMQPDLLLTDSTPTGGDMGAHVWGPSFLRDELLPRFRLSGWTPDWYSGFPAFHFYMVIPALLIVLLDIGLTPFVAYPVVAALAAGAGVSAIQGDRVVARRLTIAVLVAAPLLIGIPYNVAFKLVSVSGIVLFPLGAWALAHFGGMRFPGPAFMAVGSLAFAFDRSFNIYGGNVASTMAGEFAASMSLTLSLVAIGLVIRGTRTGQYRRVAAVFIALTGLTHLLPAFFVLTAVGVTMMVRLAQRRWASIPWLLTAGGLSAFVSAFWVLPFFVRTDYLNDMGWERIELIHSPLVTRSILNPSEILSNYPPLPVLLVLAAVGVVLSIVRRVELGLILTGTGALMAIGFVWFPDGRLWNARILPFYYLCVALVAVIGVVLAVQLIARASLAVRGLLAAAALISFAIPAVRDGWIWPEPGQGAYLAPAAWYTLRVLATAILVIVILTELSRFVAMFAGPRWPVVALSSLAVLVMSPARDIGSMAFPPRNDRSVFVWIVDVFFGGPLIWGVILFVAIMGLVLTLMAAARTVSTLQAAAGVAPNVDDGGPSNDPVDGRRSLLPAADAAREVVLASPIGALAVGLVLFGLALNSVGGIGQNEAGVREWSMPGLHITSDDNSFLPGWATWNYSGLQAKPGAEGGAGDVGQGGWEEYRHIQRTMLGVGEEVGCGRAMWEFAPELNRYGTTMAMMLLPTWTNGCIGSMEGLYFEATPTVPYHFMLQSDLSAPSRRIGDTQSVGGPSRAMRDLPYGDFDIDVGVDRMHELGVRYYLSFSPQSIKAARDHPALTEIAASAPWVIFETDAPVVEALTVEPVVIDGVRNHQDQWLDLGIEWFTAGVGLDQVRPASSGPASWQRVDASEIVERYEAPDTRLAGSVGADDEALAGLLPVTAVADPASVGDIELDTDRIRFSVDTIGTPILIRTSYFPAWKVDGAEGPYRVAPNAMVVVPTENTVELRYGRTLVDWVSLLLTALGFAGLMGLGRLPFGAADEDENEGRTGLLDPVDEADVDDDEVDDVGAAENDDEAENDDAADDADAPDDAELTPPPVPTPVAVLAPPPVPRSADGGL